MRSVTAVRFPPGIRLATATAGEDPATARRRLDDWLDMLGLRAAVQVQDQGATGLLLTLRRDAAEAWVPDHDTLGLRAALDATLGEADAATVLEREAAVALLGGPVEQSMPSLDEWFSAVRMRRHLADAASRTAMDFHTSRVNRPAAYWDHDEDRGFTLKPGASLIEALRVTTQPAVSGELYAFSCYRATEYIVLLGLATELAAVNPGLLMAIERHWQRAAIVSGRFHDVFLRELGTNEDPLPPRWYVPGDRVWFRNPDDASSDASGYEGSWTMYLGGGLFANMWQRDRPFTLEAKCVEIHHWRSATYRDAEGDLRIDEAVVAREVARTEADAVEREAIVRRMMRLRDLRGVRADGGCLDRTRESPRWVHPPTCDIVLPEPD